MKQNFKRFLSWTLALLMTLSLLPAGLLTVPAHAEELVDELVNDAQAEEFTVQATRAAVTFLPPEAPGCSFNANNQNFSKDSLQRSINGNSIPVQVFPAEGYRFLGWYYVTNSVVAAEPFSTETDGTLTFKQSCTVTARFATQDTATFKVGNETFTGLQAAIDYAQENSSEKTITLTNNGSIYGDYTIPTGITLLIPFDEAGTVDTNAPGYAKAVDSNRIAFRKLTMEKDASITVQGAISVGGKHYTCSNSNCCITTGPYGQIQMEAGSSITLENDASLYAWGYITGDGQITANSGAEVYEYFQIMDWRGGRCTSAMERNKKKVFPFSQYYVQNIEAALTICKGAQEYAYVTVADAEYKYVVSTKIQFIGDSGSLFSLGEGGTITKWYDASKDRIQFEIEGQAGLESIKLSFKLLSFLSYTVDSSDYVLPINNNVDMQILSGTMTVSKDAALLPGVTVSIAKGAELKVAENANLYVYDADEWENTYLNGSGSNGIRPVAYSPSGKGSRTVSDATIDVNGTLTAAGAIYTTASGANICSSKGTGVYVQQGQLGKSSETYQCIQNGKTPNYTAIPITPAKLHNEDGSYEETKNYPQGSEIKYEYNAWGGKPAAITVSFDANGGSGTMSAQSGTAGQNITLQRNCFAYANYTFTGWNTAADGTGTRYDDGATASFTENTTLYAQWTQKPVVTFDANGGDGSMSPQTVEPNAATPLIANAFTRADYDFTGWNTAKDGSGTAYADQAAVTLSGNCTLYAQWTLHKYHVRWLNGDGTILKEGDYTCKENAYYDMWFEEDQEPIMLEDDNYTYKFLNRWTPYDEAEGINGWGFYPHKDIDFMAVFNKFEKLTVTFNANGGTGTMDPVKIPNGSSDTSYTLPRCRFTAPQGKRFDCWLITGTVGYDQFAKYDLFNDKWDDESFLAFSDLTLKASWKACTHTWDDGTVTTPATCTVAGVKTFTCSVCNATKTETIPANGHTGGEAIRENEVAATCTKEGSYDEVVYCTVCKAEISRSCKTIEKTAHTEVIDEAVAATCTTPGKTEGKHCSVCNEVLVAQTEIPAKGHTEVVDAAVEPTCTKPGKTEGKHCSVCNTVTIAQTEIPAKGHTEVTDAAVEPTCTEPGKTEGKHCSVCNTVLAAQKEIPALNHAWKTEWEKNGEKHWHKCSRCNAVDAEAAHTFGKWRVTKAADYVTPGEKTHTCSVCNAVETKPIPSILQQLKDLRITAAEDGRRTMTLPTGKKVLVLLAGYSGVGQLKSIQVLSVGETGEVTFTRPDSEKAMLFFLQEDYKPLCSRKVTQ